METGARKLIVRFACACMAVAAVFAWISTFAYANWLRFVSPRAPNAATGQVVYEKALKGVFYVTAGQWWWTNTVLPYIAACAGLALVGFLLTRDRDEPRRLVTQDDLRTPLGQTLARVSVVLGLIAFVLGWSLTLFGDNIMALIFTGSLYPPGHMP